MMPRTDLPSRKSRVLISGFVLLNLATVLWTNTPPSVLQVCREAVDAHFSPQNAYRIRYVDWRWQQYAHVVGLNNRWQMFGRQSRFNWWYSIRAIYSDGETEKSVLLPLPNQSPRTFLDRYVFDLKECKFELNIYLNEVARESYSRYLMRQYSEHEGMPIRSIRWFLGTQMILEPKDAVAQHRLHASEAQVRLLNEFFDKREATNRSLVSWRSQ
jgi:hypothetical protein